MPAKERTPYLFLLARPSMTARREAAKRLRELGATVIAQFGAEAVEGLVTPEQAAAATELGLFSGQLKGAMSREHMARLTDEQRAVVTQWNTRFSRNYRRLKKDMTHVGKSWGDPEMSPLIAYSAIDPEDFLSILAAYQERTGQRIGPRETARGRTQEGDVAQAMTPDEFVEFERQLADRYQDPNLGYHLARLGHRMGRRYRDTLLNLPADLIAEIIKLLFGEAACWEMTGEMAVGIVFVESSKAGGPKFSASERSDICQEIFDGHSWLAGEHPDGNLSWVYDLQFVKIDVANGTGDPDEAYWRDPAMGKVNYNGNTYPANWSGVADYREDMRIANWAAHAIVVFVTPYANSWHAYAGGGRVTLANKNNWGGWGRSTLDSITAHETSHLFGSADEYTGSGTPCSSCDTTHGCDNIPNGNCGACSHPHQTCVMDQNTKRLCGYSRGHIGWSSLFVELTTADVLWAGTDDDVWIDIGDRQFVLDTPDFDDRERNSREGYPIWEPSLQRSDIKRVLIRKSPDGFAGGWMLHRVRVWFQGELVCDHDRIDQWLEDDHRTWLGCINNRELVNTLRIKVATGDVAWAGTDDDVTLTLAGRHWDLDNPDHDDFERGNTDTFDLDPGSGLYRSDIHSVRIAKSPDGFAGGWRLGGFEILVNGTSVFANHAINQWLEDDHRVWSQSI
jgi:hypothetical protein